MLGHQDLGTPVYFIAMFVFCCGQVLEDYAVKFSAAEWAAAKERCICITVVT